MFCPVLMLALIFLNSGASRDVFLVVVPALGFILVYALFTHFEYRYGTPAVPLAVVAGTVLVTAFGRALLSRFERVKF